MSMLKLLQERDVEESLPKGLDENDVNNIMPGSDDYMDSYKRVKRKLGLGIS